MRAFDRSAFEAEWKVYGASKECKPKDEKHGHSKAVSVVDGAKSQEEEQSGASNGQRAPSECNIAQDGAMPDWCSYNSRDGSYQYIGFPEARITYGRHLLENMTPINWYAKAPILGNKIASFHTCYYPPHSYLEAIYTHLAKLSFLR